jgi:hypothetical protein
MGLRHGFTMIMIGVSFLAGCGGGGGEQSNDRADVFLGGIYEGTLPRIKNTCPLASPEISAFNLTVNQDSDKIVVQVASTGATYVGGPTSEKSFLVSNRKAEDPCAVITLITVQYITHDSASLNVSIGSACAPIRCVVEWDGAVTRRTS